MYGGGEELGAGGFSAGQGRFQAGDLRQKLRHRVPPDLGDRRRDELGSDVQLRE